MKAIVLVISASIISVVSMYYSDQIVTYLVEWLHD